MLRGEKPAFRPVHPSAKGVGTAAAGNEVEEPGFERGSSRSYVLETDRQLGELLRVHVQQVASVPSMQPAQRMFVKDKLRCVLGSS